MDCPECGLQLKVTRTLPGLTRTTRQMRCEATPGCLPYVYESEEAITSRKLTGKPVEAATGAHGWTRARISSGKPPPIRVQTPSTRTNSTGGEGGGLSEDQEESGSNQESGSGSGSDPGPSSSPDAGARAIPRRLDLAKAWAAARFAELGGFEWTGTMGLSPPKLAEVTATVRATPSLEPLLAPTMRQFWAEVRDGKLPESQAYIDNNPLAFGAWVSRFGPYAEKVSGRAPAAPRAAQNGASGAKPPPADDYRPMPE